MIHEDIQDFNKQFSWEPQPENKGKLKKFKRVVLCGMGGSHLAANLLKACEPELPLAVWNDYGLPPIPKNELKDTLVVASSYSGNTEETIDGLLTAMAQKMNVAVIASGGKLLDLARMRGIPAIALPDYGLQPRMAIGYSARAMLFFLKDKKLYKAIEDLSHDLRHAENDPLGKALASQLSGNVPIIYASRRNAAVALNWKIVLNETGKIPAFWNVFPELNHNEMTGFDVRRSTRDLSERFHFILLEDADDGPHIAKRMRVLHELYRSRFLKVEMIPLRGQTRAAKVFSAVNLAQWTAYYTATNYGVEPEEVPMVEEFKKLISS